MLSAWLLCFRHRHCESFLVNHFGGLVILVYLSIFLFGLFFFTPADVIFWSNFNWLNVVSFSQPNCMRGDNRHVICTLVIRWASWWSAPNWEAWTVKALIIDCNCCPHRFCYALKISVNGVNFWDAEELHFDGYYLLMLLKRASQRTLFDALGHVDSQSVWQSVMWQCCITPRRRNAACDK